MGRPERSHDFRQRDEMQRDEMPHDEMDAAEARLHILIAFPSCCRERAMAHLLRLPLIVALCVPALAQSPSPSLPVSAISQANMDAAFAYHLARKGEAMIVQQNGKPIFTKFSAGYDDGPHPLASGTKSFSCAMEAFAEADGLLKLDEAASKTITEWQADSRKSITIADLLSLEAGLKSAGLIGGKVRSLDTYAEAVDRVPIRAPGTTFIYDPLNFQDFAIILQVKTGGTYGGGGVVTGGTDPVAYLQEKLLTPLGIDAGDVRWARDAQHHPQMAGGAALHATEWLRYGQFMLDGGKWNGKQLIDARLLARCSQYVGPAYQGYGLSFWLNRLSVKRTSTFRNPTPRDGTPPPGMKQTAPDVPADMYMAAGLGKQRLYIIPSLHLVVERLAPISSEDDTDWSDNQFLALLLGTAK
jgi:CubicO group peptidase (beta-lactamase class C family)